MHTLLAQQLTLPGQSASIQGPLQPSVFGGTITIGSILSRAIPYIFIFAGVALFLMILTSGFTFLTSAGDAKKLEQGRQRITFAVVGFIIIFAAFWLVQIFGAMFGLDSIKNSFQ
jgi:hypothetical protein